MNRTAFHIAKRYILAKKGSQAVSFITRLASIAMMFAVASMFVIISVFSGLENLNKNLIKNLHADVTIKNAKEGKTIPEINKVINFLKSQKEISSFSKTIEEKVYLTFNNVGEIAYLRAVDSLYTTVNPIDENIFYGTYPSSKNKDEVLLEGNLDNRLSIPVGTNESEDYAILFMPKAGKGLIKTESDIFNKKEIYVSGVFSGKEQMNNYIIAPIELAEELLDLPKGSAYNIDIKLKEHANADTFKTKLQKKLGSNIKITTKKEENATFWKMINTEKLMIYLIFGLVIFITTFNLAGAIIIIQLDKKEQSKTLYFMGFPLTNIKRIYFYTGMMIVFLGIVSGLILGTILCYLQIETEFFKSGDFPFPVEINFNNYIIVSLIALFFGFIISYLFSKIKKSDLEK